MAIFRLSWASALLVLAVAAPAAALDPVYSNFWGVAIRGADPVAYFAEGQRRDGREEHSHEWRGATWRFSSEANRAAFAADPERFAPQYGGYCAYAVAKGSTASVDPDAWKIVDGKLYLNYSKSIQKTWEQDIPGYIAKADANWPGLVGG